MRNLIFPQDGLLRAIFLTLVFTFAGIVSAVASHNLAGEITYKYLGNNRVEITVTTYTDPSAALVDRCAVDLEIWNAAGTIKIDDLANVPRQNGPFGQDPVFPINCASANMGEYIIGTVKQNIYKVEYQFPGPGWYLVRYYDLARLDNIINMTNSGQQAFFIETSILINPFLGEENSPQFLNHPLDDACTGKPWSHNPGGFDPDGDSLNYILVECRQYDPPAIPSPITCTGYQFPDQVGNNGPFQMDPVTGLLTWNNPEIQGIYNIAYRIEEYRDGILIGFSFRDMAIFVYPCNNNPPVIEALLDTCIYAGETLTFDFKAYDPDFFTSQNPPGDSIYFYLNNGGFNNNGPFSVPVSPATITFQPPGPPPIAHDDTVRGTFTWATVCDHIRPAFYQVDFYAHDNISYYGTQMLSANHIVRINVIPPPTTGLVATAANNQVTLNWDAHPCDSIVGYEIFRSIGGGNFGQDSVCCDTDPTLQGFEMIGTTLGQNATTFVDDNNGLPFDFGVDVCYIVRAWFDDGIRACFTNEVCLQIDKDFPVLVQDSIDITSISGQIYISWSQPTEIDSIFPEPYTYHLLRADDISGAANWQTIATGIPFDDTTAWDAGMNTVDQGYRYRVDVYDATDNLIANGNVGSSIYLTITPGDEQLLLQWREFVPWDNRVYYIRRADSINGTYVDIDTVVGTGASLHTYLDTGLENFEDYCYVIVSEGEYDTPDVMDSVRNASQRVCGVPQDLEPPCINSALFDTTRDCRAHTITFNWDEPDSLCAADVDYYTIWRADNRTSDYIEIARVDSGVNFFNVPNIGTIADCYGITATDTNGNESEMVIFCFENCPEIEIGNVFTPNGDGINDWFSPIRDRNVEVSEIVIFDRWGRQIFVNRTITDIMRLWDGKTANGNDVPDGVYYYVIKYKEERLPEMVPKPPLAGHVTLLR